MNDESLGEPLPAVADGDRRPCAHPRTSRSGSLGNSLFARIPVL